MTDLTSAVAECHDLADYQTGYSRKTLKTLGGPGSGPQGHKGDIKSASILYAKGVVIGRKVTKASKAILQGKKTVENEYTEAANTLIQSIREAPEENTVLYRGLGSKEPIPELDNLKVGDTITLGQLSSFSENQHYSNYYAGASVRTSQANDMGFEPRTGHFYELTTTGPVKSVKTDEHTGLGHEEHVTQGKFEVVSVNTATTATKVAVESPHDFTIKHDRSITLRQIGVF